jgi:hypothetical protein
MNWQAMMARQERRELAVFWRLMAAIALAEAIDKAPFLMNPHRLPYRHYRCPHGDRSFGARIACEHSR